MKIQEFSKRLNVSKYTIRYYEKIGVLKPIKRNKSGYREFCDSDLLWMEFVIRLKNTSMPIEEIIRYANLREIGDTTKQERLRLLESHEDRIRGEIDAKKNNLLKIQEKIRFYKRID